MLNQIGLPEILIILLIVLLVFGAKRMPEIGASMGKGIREFKKSLTEMGSSGSSKDEIEPTRPFDSTSNTTTTTGEPKKLSQ